jgi:glycosidase
MNTLSFPRPIFRALLLAALLVAPSSWIAAAGSLEGELKDGWWRDAVFYEIFVRSFADASSGPLAGDGVGDFQGLIERLDYLNDGKGAAGKSLGVTALWLMPIHPSPSYHGYDVTDYFGVHPEFGDLELVKRFVAEARRRGIRVIIDFVLNHASSRHPLFLEALREPMDGETRGLFRFADVPLELFGPWDQRAWHPAGAAGGGGFYYGVFSDEMPDWNFNHPKVTEHHYRAAEFWLKEVGVDGFRLDAVRYFHEVGEALQDTEETRQWLKGFTEHCHRVKPGSFVIAENTARTPEVARGIRGGAVDSSFEFDLARATIEAVRLRMPAILTRTLQRLDTIYEGDSPWASLLTNHDQERARTQLDGSEPLTRLATKVLFTLPGVTFLYYGEELGMQAAKPDPELRTPMPWTAESPNAGFARPGARAWMAPKPDFVTVNVAAQLNEPDSMLTLYRRLIALNASSPSLRHGRRVTVTSSDRGLYAEMRETADEVVLVLGNFGREVRLGAELTVEESALRTGWTVREELEGETVHVPEISGRGGFTNWRPVAKLKPESVYVVRWQR